MIQGDLNQSRLSGGARLPRLLLPTLLRRLVKKQHLTRPCRVSVAFVSPKEMRRFNRLYRGVDAVTDVLSFNYTTYKKVEPAEYLGEILLNYEQIVKQARALKHGIRYEAAYLMAHGLLHLLGFDHEKSAVQAARMLALEQALLADFPY